MGEQRGPEGPNAAGEGRDGPRKEFLYFKSTQIPRFPRRPFWAPQAKIKSERKKTVKVTVSARTWRRAGGILPRQGASGLGVIVNGKRKSGRKVLEEVSGRRREMVTAARSPRRWKAPSILSWHPQGALLNTGN